MFVSFPHPSLLRPFDPLAPFANLRSPCSVVLTSRNSGLTVCCWVCFALHVQLIKKTLETAQARLRDVDNNSLIYVRRIGNNDWHSVVVREDGTIEDQTVTARLATQFSMSRQARQFRLPVDEEDTSLALWRINTPLVQSGEPETRNRGKSTEQNGPVNPMSPAGEAMKMIAKLTGAESKTTFNGGTYTAGGALSPDGKLDKQAGDKWRASRQQITAARVIDTLSTRLVSAVKAAKKSGVEVSTETMNTALGNLDNPLT